MTTYKAIKLVKRPEPGPVSADIFEVTEKELPKAGSGEILIKQRQMSLDPAMFGWMSPDTESYIPPVELNTVMRSSGVGEGLESAIEGLNMFFTGDNKGKLIVKL